MMLLPKLNIRSSSSSSSSSLMLTSLEVKNGFDAGSRSQEGKKEGSRKNKVEATEKIFNRNCFY